jgi:hypothetical protein
VARTFPPPPPARRSPDCPPYTHTHTQRETPLVTARTTAKPMRLHGNLIYWLAPLRSTHTFAVSVSRRRLGLRARDWPNQGTIPLHTPIQHYLSIKEIKRDKKSGRRAARDKSLLLVFANGLALFPAPSPRPPPPPISTPPTSEPIKYMLPS